MEYFRRQNLAKQVLPLPRMDFPSWNADKSEAVGQSIIIFLMTASLLVLHIPEVRYLATNLPCCSDWDGCGTILTIRFSAVFIIFLALCSVVELFRIFRPPPTACFWFAKVVIIVSGCCASVYIPPPTFDRTWKDFLLFGGMTFIVVEVYVIVRLSYVVIIKIQRMVEEGSMSARRLQITLFIFAVVAPVLGEILLIYYYPLCGLNLVFLVTNAVIPFIVCLWSTSDCVKETNGYSSFAQGGVFACFVIFYTWSALGSHPDPMCNPYFERKGTVLFKQCVYLLCAHIVYVLAVFFSYHVFVEEAEKSLPSTETDESPSDSSVHRKPKIIVREEIVHVYIPHFYSFLSTSMMCYVSQSLLNWTSSDMSESLEKESRTVMWFKLVGCWFSVLFFVITLYTPSVYGIFPKNYVLRRI